jgi:hypothetical protein
VSLDCSSALCAVLFLFFVVPPLFAFIAGPCVWSLSSFPNRDVIMNTSYEHSTYEVRSVTYFTLTHLRALASVKYGVHKQIKKITPIKYLF